MEKIDGSLEILLSEEEAALFARQAAAQASSNVSKADADYQNEPKEDESCQNCSMYVPGLPDDVAGYCTKVRSFRGPLGMIFPDGWCKFFEEADLDEEVLDDMLDEPPQAQDEFREADHPRDDDGKFATGSGSGTGSPGRRAEIAAMMYGKGSPAHQLALRDAREERAQRGAGRWGKGEAENRTSGLPKGSVGALKEYKAVASELYKQYSDPKVTVADVMKKFPPEAAAAMQAVEKEIAAGTPTTAPVDKGGHIGPDGRYTPERKKVHMEILRNILNPETVARATPEKGQKPVITMLGGRGGSGKSWITNKAKGGPVDSSKALVLDSDQIKSMLPGYKPALAALYHDESSDILNEVGETARKLGLNVIYDATMQRETSILPRLERHLEAGYDVHAFYMFVPPEQAAERAAKRFWKNGNANGRYVPPHVVLGNRTNEDVFDRVKEFASNWGLYQNMGEAPQFVAGHDHGKQQQQGG